MPKKKIQEPAYKDNFLDGYEHALKDAYDHLVQLQADDAGFSVGEAIYKLGELQGRLGIKISKCVKASVAEWKRSRVKRA